MAALVGKLLHAPDVHFRLAWRAPGVAPNGHLLAAGVLGAMCWGAAMGCHVGRAHVWITTLKMPLFFLATLALCFPLMHITLLVSGIRARASQTLTIALSGISTLAVCLGACAPVVALFCASAPIPSMASYLNLYVLCLACGIVAGIAGLRVLARGMRSLNRTEQVGIKAPLIAWALVYQFVGAQMAWLLRPWIGSSYGVDGYSLSHGLSGNFYMGVWAVLMRWLQELGAIS
ncbi:MAG: hypothetical protein H6839_11870 [Planctomycetes bacterium]|nr:hypothetical protein [Planctomycetota bacterium]